MNRIEAIEALTSLRNAMDGTVTTEALDYAIGYLDPANTAKDDERNAALRARLTDLEAENKRLDAVQSDNAKLVTAIVARWGSVRR